MIPRLLPATVRANEPTRVGPPPHFDIDTIGFMCLVCSCHSFCSNEQTSRQFGISLPAQSVAAPPYSDFVSGVGRAYKTSATNRPKQAFQRLLGTSVDSSQSTGSDGEIVAFLSRTRLPNTAPGLRSGLKEQRQERNPVEAVEAVRGKLWLKPCESSLAQCAIFPKGLASTPARCVRAMTHSATFAARQQRFRLALSNQEKRSRWSIQRRGARCWSDAPHAQKPNS